MSFGMGCFYSREGTGNKIISFNKKINNNLQTCPLAWVVFIVEKGLEIKLYHLTKIIIIICKHVLWHGLFL